MLCINKRQSSGAWKGKGIILVGGLLCSCYLSEILYHLQPTRQIQFKHLDCFCFWIKLNKTVTSSASNKNNRQT